MKLKKLDTTKNKKVMIGLVCLFLVGITLIFRATMAKYKLTESIPLARGTINYELGDFNVIAMYQENENGTYDEIQVSPSSGYVINEEKSYCIVNGEKDTNIVLKTINGMHTFSSIKPKSKCYIFFVPKLITVDDIISLSNAKDKTPDFSKTATTDEGIYKISDGMYIGVTYYWRGAVTTNHVIFANKCWRIIRINGDNTIRLIYNGTPTGTTCPGNGVNTLSVAITSQSYNSNYYRSEYVGWTYEDEQQRTLTGTDSNIKTQTETWYNNNIGNNVTYSSKVADGKFCNDRNAGLGGASTTWSTTGTSFYYAGLTRLNSYIPTFSCSSGDIYTLKIGAITSDEAMFAGANSGNNTFYYLYNGQSYWTMSPYYWYSNSARVFVVYSNGNLDWNNVQNTTPGVRPVINLKADTTFSVGGTGTSSNPYIVE